MGRATKGAQEAGLSNDRQEMFCRAYLANGLNAKAACIAVGYSIKGAEVQAARLLGSAKVQARIAQLQAPIIEKLEITTERVLNETAMVAFSRATDVMSWGPGGVNLLDSAQVDAEKAAAVSKARQTVSAEGGSISLDMHDKLSALKLLGQYLKLWGDNKIEVTMPWAKELAAMTADELRARADALRAAREKE